MKRADLTRLLVECKNHGVRLGQRDMAFIMALGARPDDQRLERSVLSRLEIRLARAELSKPVFSVPGPTEGDLNLGRNAHGPTWVKLGGEQAHLLQTGQSGAGKTNNTITWLVQLAGECEGIVIFDMHKREYRPLIGRFAEAGKKLSVCHGRQMCIAPITPPHKNISPLSWGMTISDLLTLSLRLPGPSSNLLRVVIRQLQETNGVLSGSSKHPTMFELQDAVRESPGNAVLKTAILNRLDALVTELGPDVLGHREGFSVPEICNRRIIFELDGLSFFAQNFLIAYILGAIFAYRIACPEERKK